MESHEPLVTYHINSNDVLVYTCNNWDSFALENDAPEMISSNVLGRKIWDFISNTETRYLYKLIFDYVRSLKKESDVIIRCDAPETIRLLNLKISYGSNGLLIIKSFPMKIQRQEYLPLLDRKVERSQEIIKMCSYCKGIEIAHEKWLSLEKALNELDLFQREKPPQISHGVCTDCYETVKKEFAMI